MAAAILQHRLALAGIAGSSRVHSVGTHVLGRRELTDPRVVQLLERHEIPFRRHRAQLLRTKDLVRFDHVLTMEEETLEYLRLISPPSLSHRIQLVTAWCRSLRNQEVLDPYFGNLAGFERVYAMLDAALDSLVWHDLGVREGPMNCSFS
jgi:protein-tyrosine phosphatase